MQRWDIINHFIKKKGYKSYLEIGYYKGWSFDRVECQNKWAVDPNPSKNSEQEELEYGHNIMFWSKPNSDYLVEYEGGLFKETSDEYFARHVNETEFKYDIIFIDGLHESEQVMRDVENSLKHLADGGMIVLHDMNPPKYEHTTTGIDGCWTGDVYKVGIKLNMRNPFSFYTIDTDWGVGILTPRKVDWVGFEGPDFPRALADWEYFDRERQYLLNLISVEQFNRRENIEEL